MPVKNLKILMAAAELAPFAKVGGLGDVCGSLPTALARLGVDVRLVLPLYGSIDRKKFKLKKIYCGLEVPSGRLLLKIDIWSAFLPNSKVLAYFIDAPEYFGYDCVYAPGNNSERYLFFSYALLHALPALKFRPDIIHCHDSHTALIPDIIKTSNLEYIKNIKTLFTIHNFHYQGKASPEVLHTGNLHVESLKTLSKDALDGDINFMVQGVLNADLVNTVSPTYADEITTSAYGAKLDNVIRSRRHDLSGILNGIDTDFFDPNKDKYITRNYSVKSLSKKTENKSILQKKLGWPQDSGKALVGFVSRLAWQKGIVLLNEEFSKLDCQFVFLGSGDQQNEKHLMRLAEKFPDKFSAQIKFEIGLAQEIYAGADILIMPSRYEPCGLSQMIAMRYGTIPVARATGGLKDTINRENGFLFKNVDSREFYEAMKEALDVYYNDRPRWKKMQIAGMKGDYSWDRSAKEYLKLYKKLVKN